MHFFDTLIVRDIQQKYSIRKPILMNHIADFMMDNISNLTSARKIADALTSSKLWKENTGYDILK